MSDHPRPTIGVGIVGLGFMGRVHLAAYRAAAETRPNRVVGVCDARLERARGGGATGGNLDVGGAALDLGDAHACTDPGELFARPDVDLVSICSPTDTHVALAKRALRAGKHVLVEKPVALDSASIEDLARVAAAADRLCMPAMCLRFWPAWVWLKRRIEAMTFGEVRSAIFRRLGSMPDWNPAFYADVERSGGALFDLHVHDVDFVHWCFGEPDSIVAEGSIHHVTSAYVYADGPAHVVAEGSWDRAPDAPFHMGYTVVFEKATAEYVFGREPELIVAAGGETHAVPVDATTGYDGEVRHLLDAIAKGASDEDLTARLSDAIEHTRTLETERAALSG